LQFAKQISQICLALMSGDSANQTGWPQAHFRALISTSIKSLFLKEAASGVVSFHKTLAIGI
jgi:hypothetical protein